MKLFVFGGSSLIGVEFIKKAVKEHHQVFSTYNKSNSINLNESAIKFCYPDDFEKIKEVILTKKPDVIVNLIAITNLEYCENNKEEVYKLNVDFPRKISEIANMSKSKVIHFSSDYVFDGEKGNYKEEDKTNPVNFYGYTKAISENEILQYHNNIVIRTAAIYDLKFKSNFLNFLFQKLSNNEKIQVYNNIQSTPIFIDDLVRTLLIIIKINESGIFHIVGDECMSKFEFAKKITKKTGFSEKLLISVSQNMEKQKIKRPKNSCLNNNKIKRVTETKFSSLDENIEKMKDNMK